MSTHESPEYEYVTLYSKKNFADIFKVKNFEMWLLFGLFGQVKCHYKSLCKQAEGNLTTGEACQRTKR